MSEVENSSALKATGPAIAEEVIESFTPLEIKGDDARGKSPAFRFYPADFLVDEKVVSMNLEQVGLYFTLLCRAWIEGSIPAKDAELCRLAGVSLPKFLKIWGPVSTMFVAREDGRLINARMEKERAKQKAYREKQSQNARQPRNRGSAMDERNPDNGSAMAEPAGARSSSSLPSSPSLPSSQKDSLASLAGETVFEETEVTRFARSFVQRALDKGLIPADRRVDFEKTVRRENLEDARVLLKQYGPAEVETRLRRFFAACKSREIHSECSIHMFRKTWGWPVVSGEPVRSSVPVGPKFGSIRPEDRDGGNWAGRTTPAERAAAARLGSIRPGRS